MGDAGLAWKFVRTSSFVRSALEAEGSVEWCVTTIAISQGAAERIIRS